MPTRLQCIQGSNLVEICTLYVEIELKIDDLTFLMAIKGLGDPLIVKP